MTIDFSQRLNIEHDVENKNTISRRILDKYDNMRLTNRSYNTGV